MLWQRVTYAAGFGARLSVAIIGRRRHRLLLAGEEHYRSMQQDLCDARNVKAP